MEYKFDSTDWDSIREGIEILKDRDSAIIGETDDGDTMMISSNDPTTLTTKVFQKNGWVRTNIYHTDDYRIEELYSRE